MTKTYILIDGSYYIFYRLFALRNWWKLSHKDHPQENLHLNQEFVEKYKKIFQQKLKEIPKKLHIPCENEIIYIIGKDCKRENIWRNKIYPEYKATRTNYKDENHQPSYFFDIVYRENLYDIVNNDITNTCKIEIDENTQIDENTKKNIQLSENTTKRNKRKKKKYKIQSVHILSEETLEADDCLAITTNYLYETNKIEIENNKEYDNNNIYKTTGSNIPEIYIITSDTDYMQLKKERIHIYNLSFTPLITEKNSFGCAKKDLLYKIIRGDTSDNIKPLFNKCTKREAIKLMDDNSLLMKKIKDEGREENYKLNRTLVDFQKIPQELQEIMIDKLKSLNI